MVDMQDVSGQYLFFKFISLRGVKFILTIVGFISCSVIMLYYSQNGRKILQNWGAIAPWPCPPPASYAPERVQLVLTHSI